MILVLIIWFFKVYKDGEVCLWDRVGFEKDFNIGFEIEVMIVVSGDSLSKRKF